MDILPEVEDNLLFTKEHCRIIKAKLNEALFASEEIAELKFSFSDYDRGRYRVVCLNPASKEWVIQTVPTLTGLWKDAKLKIVQAGTPPKLLRATFTLRFPSPEPGAIFSALEK